MNHKDTSENNPEISHRTIPSAHDSTENRTRTSDIEELNHKDLPTRKHHEIYAVRLGDGRRRTVVRTECACYKLSVNHVA